MDPISLIVAALTAGAAEAAQPTAAKAVKNAEILQTMQALQAQLNKANGSNVATVSGGRAIAQGTGAIAAGAGAVIVQGSNSGGINTGTQTTHNYYGAANDEAAAANLSPAGRHLAELLNQYFDLSELEGLCFDMDIDKDNLAGATKIAKAQSLIIYVERNARLAELQTLVRAKRPHLRGQV